MPSIVRKSTLTIAESRREILHAVSWQVRSTMWNPPTDQYETEDAYVIRMEIAGMRESDFEIALEDNVLRISGVRSDLPERRAYHQMEIRFGKFVVSVDIPGPIENEQATADYKDGFLLIVLPKIKPKQIKVE
ncbi:MAG: Hsp20/alpha crystallin family protein [Anaerolineales bacterium]